MPILSTIFLFYFSVKNINFLQNSTKAIINVFDGSNFTEFIGIYNVAKEILRMLIFNSKYCLVAFCGL